MLLNSLHWQRYAYACLYVYVCMYVLCIHMYVCMCAYVCMRMTSLYSLSLLMHTISLCLFFSLAVCLYLSLSLSLSRSIYLSLSIHSSTTMYVPFSSINSVAYRPHQPPIERENGTYIVVELWMERDR